MYNYLLVVMAAILYAADFVFQKCYQRKQGTGLRVGLLFNAGVGLCTSIIFLFVNKFQIQFSLSAILLAICMSLCVWGYTMFGFKVLKEGNMAFYTLFLMTGGMVVPYVCGVLFWKEPLSSFRLIGLLFIIVAIILSNYSVSKSSAKIVMYCVIVFFLNGGSSVFSKLSQMPNGYDIIEPTQFVFWTGITRFILCFVAILALKCKTTEVQEQTSVDKVTIIFIVCSAVMSGLGFMFQLYGAAKLPATVLYPIISGGSIIFSTFAGMLCFKEKPSLYQKIGVVLCFVGTCMFL